MATARLANMPAVTGLYAFIAGSVVFALLGRNPRLSVGADSTIAPIIAAGAAGLAAVGSASYRDTVSFLALMVGVLVVLVGLLRAGWVSDFLSTPIVAGVLGGIAVDIAVRQLPSVLGVAGGGTTTIGRLEKIAGQIGHTNPWTVGLAAAVLLVIVGAEAVDRRLPGALIGLVGSVLLVTALGPGAHGIAVLGAVHGGLPRPDLPHASWHEIGRLLVPALTITFVCAVQSAATERAGGGAGRAADDFNRDLVALGAGSLVAALGRSFAVDASPPRTEVIRTSGGRTQLAGLLAAGAVVVIVLVGTGLLRNLPVATLGAILLFVATRLLKLRLLRDVLRFDPVEFALALVTLLAVAFIGIEQGVAIAIGLSLAVRTKREARPPDFVLGREPGTDHWIAPGMGRPTEQVPGIVVYLLAAPVWYGNAAYVKGRAHDLVDAAAQPVHGFVLDANGISDIDFTGAGALRALHTELRDRGVTFAIARSSELVRSNLEHSGLLDVIGPERLFPDVDAAVQALVRPP